MAMSDSQIVMCVRRKIVRARASAQRPRRRSALPASSRVTFRGKPHLAGEDVLDVGCVHLAHGVAGNLVIEAGTCRQRHTVERSTPGYARGRRAGEALAKFVLAALLDQPFRRADGDDRVDHDDRELGSQTTEAASHWFLPTRHKPREAQLFA